MGVSRYAAALQKLLTTLSIFHHSTLPLTLHTPGSPPQKGVTTYALSANRQNPLAGTAQAAVFNTFRRSRNQIMYWAPPLLIAYYAMNWAVERYVLAGYSALWISALWISADWVRALQE